MLNGISENLKTRIIKTYVNESIQFIDSVNNINCVDGLKAFCHRNGIRLVIYNENNDIMIEQDGEKFDVNGKIQDIRLKYMPLYCFYGGNQYTLLPDNLLKKIMPQCNNKLSSYKKRDSDRNEKTVLLDELIRDRNKFNGYHIVVWNTFEFKYEYLVERVNNKKVIDVIDEDVRLMGYLLTNFGLHTTLVHDDIVIKREDIGETFLEDYKNYAFKNSLIYRHDFYVEGKKGEGKCELLFKIKDNLTLHNNSPHVRICDINNYIVLQNIMKHFDEIVLYKTVGYNEYILNVKYIDTHNLITKDDFFELSKIMTCNICGCHIDVLKKGTLSIDAINPLLGHTKKNCCLMCRNCNSSKGIKYFGKYESKPYYYDIDSLDNSGLIVILKRHYEQIEYCRETRTHNTEISFYKLYRSIDSRKNEKTFLVRKLHECVESLDRKEDLINKLRECPVLSKSFKKRKERKK
jgi:hypothetical protein